MKNTVKTLALGALIAGGWSTQASAATSVVQLRLSPVGVGNYEFNLFDSKAEGDILSTDLGLSYVVAFNESNALIFDLELEYLGIDGDDGGGFDRHDFKFTTGFKTGIGLTPFVGYRTGSQGDGFNDTEFAKETGFFLGASYSLDAGDSGRLTFGAAYNFNTYEARVDDQKAGEFDSKGLSAKISYLFSNFPVFPMALNLKYQSFSEDGDFSDTQGNSFELDYEESYFYLNATFYLMSKAF